MRTEFIALLVTYVVMATYIVLASIYARQQTSFFLNALSILVFTSADVKLLLLFQVLHFLQIHQSL